MRSNCDLWTSRRDEAAHRWAVHGDSPCLGYVMSPPYAGKWWASSVYSTVRLLIRAVGHPQRDLRAGPQPQLGEDVRDVRFRGAPSNYQSVGNFIVGQPLGDENGHFLLAGRQRSNSD